MWTAEAAGRDTKNDDYTVPSTQVPLVEVKAYRQIALLSSAFVFRWSKWNMACNSTNVVIKVQYATLSSKEETGWQL